MTRISKASLTAIAITCVFSAFYIAIAIISIVSGSSEFSLYGLNTSMGTGNAPSLDTVPFGSSAWIVFVIGILISAAPTVLALAILLRVLAAYYRGAIFTADNARRYRNIGLILIVDALVTTTVGESIRVLAATLNNPPGERLLSISVGSTNICLLFAGTVMVTIALVMQEASRIHDENQLTV